MRSRIVSVLLVTLFATLLTLNLDAVDSRQSADSPLRVKEFVVMGYQGIVAELSSGKGPYLRTLEDLLHVEPGRQNQAEDQIRGLAKSTANIMDFAERVAALLESAPRLLDSSVGAPPSLSPLPHSQALYTGDRLETALQHLTRGMKITVYLQTGEIIEGRTVEYDAGRLSVRGPTMKSFKKEQIRAIEAPDL